MGNRRALLIGVSEYDGDLFESLGGAVNADIAKMAAALQESDYALDRCAPDQDGGRQPNRGAIQQALRRACLEAPPGGVLLIYYSGHGIVIDGASYLVPSDVYADLDDETLPATDSLIPLVPRAVEKSPASLIVLVVDACRDDPEGRPRPALRGGQLHHPPNGSCVLLTSCAPGQASGYDESGSYFTQTFSEVLARRNPASAFEEVFTATRQQMARRMAHTDAAPQTPERTWAGDRTAVPICEGDRISTAWRRAVELTPLWSRAEGAPALVGKTREAVLEVVETCARDWLAAESVLKSGAGLSDPWSKHTYPTRVLTALDLCLSPDTRLSPQELGLLVAAPFLREAVMADGIREASRLRPASFERSFAQGLRDDLELTFAMHEHVCRRAEGLEKRDRLDARDALAMWLVHRWLVARPRLWEGAAAREVSGRLATRLAANGCPGYLTPDELAAIARVLMHGIGADPEDQRLIERIRGRDFTDRTRALVALLAVAGIMAADPRRMPTVVVDHLGITDELQLSSLQRAVELLTWEHGPGGTLHLTVACDHAAIHDALEHVATQAERARTGFVKLDGMNAALLAALPPRLTSDETLRAVNRDGQAVYDTPLLAFRLSDEKIRELLMGRQLYGDPALAIRELYQNALDACRYRQIRRRYRELCDHQLAPWTGRITFRQGRDEASGRAYIECSDNGVGMKREALENTFANAGERFVYRQDFRYEQALWQEKDPSLRLIPNSQFGIGVFSYFMIADEIEITTRAVNHDDQIGTTAQSIRIASSGSLFQITEAPGEPEGGTRVRLYLTGDDHVSTLGTLRRLLWLSEFQVEVVEDGVGQETWLPETLRNPGGTVEPLQHGDDLWWISGEGGIAADGIRTNEEMHGLVVNLRGRNRPRFTVDRNTLQDWDKDWIRAQIQASLPQLLEWPEFSLTWLWRVNESTPEIAQQIFEYIVENDIEVPIGGPWGRNETAPMRKIGCLPIDHKIVAERDLWWFGNDSEWVRSWRIGIWAKNGIIDSHGNLPTPDCLDGFPTVEPYDAHAIKEIYGGGYGTATRYGRPTVERLLTIKSPKGEVPLSRLRRLRRFAIAGLDVSCLRFVPLPEQPLEEEEKPFQLVLAAWARGSGGDRCLGESLAKVSAQMKVPVGELLRRIEELVPAGAGELELDLGELREHVFTDLEVKLFSVDLDGQAPWIDAEVSPAHVARASSSLDLPVSTILEMFDRFAPLGYRVAKRASYPSELTTVEIGAFQALHEVDRVLRPIEFFALATKLEKDVHELADELQRVADAEFFTLPDFSAVAGGSATEIEAEMLSDIQSGLGRRMDRYRHGPWAVVDQMMRKIGLSDRPGYHRRLNDYRRFAQLADLRRPITVPEALDLAASLRCDIKTAVRHYMQVYADAADVSLITPEAMESGLTSGDYLESNALIGGYRQTEYSQLPIEWKLEPWRILQNCATSHLSVQEFLHRLFEYRSLGAPIPDLGPETMADYETFFPDRHDLAMTSCIDDYGETLPVNRIDALHLVKTAGRFGWTLAYTHQRFARIEPLGLELNYPRDACPDELVHWQDLLVITTFLDGQAPVVNGVVGREHIAAAAREVEESEEAVVTRLRKYRPLFGYSLEGDDGH